MRKSTGYSSRRTLQMSPVTSKQIKSWTRRDPVLAKIRDKVLQGWVSTSDPNLLPYQCRKQKLGIEDGFVLWGNRVVFSPPGRAKVLDTLHEGHPGMARMKSLRCESTGFQTKTDPVG